MRRSLQSGITCTDALGMREQTRCLFAFFVPHSPSPLHPQCGMPRLSSSLVMAYSQLMGLELNNHIHATGQLALR